MESKEWKISAGNYQADWTKLHKGLKKIVDPIISISVVGWTAYDTTNGGCTVKGSDHNANTNISDFFTVPNIIPNLSDLIRHIDQSGGTRVPMWNGSIKMDLVVRVTYGKQKIKKGKQSK